MECRIIPGGVGFAYASLLYAKNMSNALLVSATFIKKKEEIIN